MFMLASSQNISIANVLLQENFRGSFAEHPVTSIIIFHHRAHGFSHGVEGIYFEKPLFWIFFADDLVVSAQVERKPQQGTFSFVPHLTRQSTFLLRRLQIHTQTDAKI